MAQIESWFTQDLKKPVKVQYLDGNVFSLDNYGNLIGVIVFDNGSPASLAGTVTANVIRSDGFTTAVTGSLSGNKASVSLPQAACAVPGVISIIIKLSNGGVVTTLCAVVANVYQSATDSIIDPGTILPSIQTLIDTINAAVASIPADYSALWETLAPTFSTGTSYATGQYCTYSGAVYRFIKPHTGNWSSSDAVVANIGVDLFQARYGILKAMCGTAKSGELQIPLYLMDGYIDSSTGGISSGAYKYSQPIKVVPGTIIKFVSGGSSSTFDLAMYTSESSNANLDESIKGNNTMNERTAIVPYGIDNVRICFPASLEDVAYIRLCFPRNGDTVVKGGFNQVKVPNLQDFREDGNLNEYVIQYDTGRYIDTSVTDHLVLATADASYVLMLVPLQDGITNITIGFPGESVGLRVAFLAEDMYTYTRNPTYNTYTGYASFETNGAKYVMYNYAGSLFYGVSVGSGYTPFKKYYTPEWFINSVKDAQAAIVQNGSKSVSIDGNNAGVLAISSVKNGLKKGVIINGEVFFSAFTSAVIGFTTGSSVGSDYVARITVDASKATFQKKGSSGTEFTHGLTITNYLKIKVGLAYGGELSVTLFSDSGSYTFTTDALAYNDMYPFFDTSNDTISYARLSFTCADFDKKYWFFGDSYFSDEDTRWMHYYEYKPLSLVNGYPGESSEYAIADLQNFIEYGKPEVIIWCMGMNDGSDTNSSTPSSTWANVRNILINLCTTKGIRLVFGTIPTVPSVNNEGKNNWIRNSDYKYIDFAKAVGANSSGEWYAGMIASDYVHPSALGAIALVSQVYADFPDGAVE